MAATLSEDAARLRKFLAQPDDSNSLQGYQFFCNNKTIRLLDLEIILMKQTWGWDHAAVNNNLSPIHLAARKGRPKRNQTKDSIQKISAVYALLLSLKLLSSPNSICFQALEDFRT